MTEEEMENNLVALLQKQAELGRKLHRFECYDLGLRLYQCRQDCKKHGHPFREVGSCNCPECMTERNRQFAEVNAALKKLEKRGEIRKEKRGNHNIWFAVVPSPTHKEGS